MKVKSASERQKNYEDSTALVPSRYKAGVSTANWKDPAKAGQDLYEQMMADPNVLARREKGIDRVSDSEWRTAADTKGSPIIGARMKAAAPKQVSRSAPYIAALESMTLPPKTADPATNVTNRVIPIAVEFRRIKNEIG